jgi:DNA-binding HxlR family transcriptional regulator
MLGKDYLAQDCGLARALEVVGERWTLLIIRDAFYGVRRYSEFREHLDIPKAVLSDRLAGLVEEGVLARLPDPDHGGRHFYELTPAGRELWPAVQALLAWGDRNRGGNMLNFHHADCGTELDAAGHCPTCDVTPPPEDILTRPRRGRKGNRREDQVARALRDPHRLLEPLTTD